MNRLNILIIEDNPALVANLFDYFESLGHSLDAAPNGHSGLHLATNHEYDAILLDIILPGMPGTEVCQRLRNELRCRTPILMLTARGELDDKLDGFDKGADDYITKPFALQELEKRIQAQVRRYRKLDFTSPVLRCADLSFNLATLEVSRQDIPIQLNPVCRKLLKILLCHSPEVVSRQQLEAEIWQDDPPDLDILRSHIYHLRLAIDKPFTQKLLKTIQGTGYRLAADD